ncbi:MAG: FAD:protein FMN transferase [Muribaculaceae bacterium]|nr:FAD:protein FMN transferase [Muribaculaceae bacterium]
MKTLKSALLGLLALAALASVTSCQQKEYRKSEGSVWATTYHITYNADRTLEDSIQAVFKAVEQSLSPFCETSLITRINRGDTTVVADSLLQRVFRASQQVCSLSGGMFDPTVAPLVNLWGFGYKKAETYEPDSAAISAALAKVGINRCTLTPDGRIAKAHPETEFNFSAITKGYACDVMADMLRRNGAQDYMVEIGGEIALGGLNPDGNPWRIMIDAPIANAKTIRHDRLTVIEPAGRAMATSGNYRNYRDTRSGRHGHTISPTTGRPIATTTLSATVLAPTGLMADALATACMALPEKEAIALVESLPDTDVLLVCTDTVTNTWRLVSTSAFPSLH